MESWQKALLDYQKSLTNAQKEVFANSSPQDILNDIQQQEETQRQSSKTRALAGKIEPLLSCIEHYGKALDVISNSSSMILSPLWGSMRVLLQVAKGYSEYFNKLLGMLERIGDVLPRYSSYSRMFSKHVEVQNALSKVYSEIITFFVKAKKVFSKSSLRILYKVLWKPFDLEFEKTLERLRNYRQFVEEAASHAHMIEAKEGRSEAAEERKRTTRERDSAAESRIEVKEIKNVLDTQNQEWRILNIQRWLNMRLCNTERIGVVEQRLPESCEWILHRKEFSDWVKKTDIQILWAHGPPGCGKSFLYSKLLDHLDTMSNFVVYFFFCDGDGERSSISSLLRSWIFQLVQLLPEAIHICERTMNSSQRTKASLNDAQELFLLLLQASPACYLTVDGIDECPDRGKFSSLIARIPGRFKILILSRESPDIKTTLLKHIKKLSVLPIEQDSTKADIDPYIFGRIQKEYALFEHQVTEKLMHRLSDNNGMFLWVRLMFEHLKSQTTISEILQCLDELPIGLNETYNRVFEKINKLPKPQRLLAHKVFFWIIAVSRPVSVNELCILLAIRTKDQELDKNRFIINPESAIESVCSPLVHIRQPGSTVFTVHFTVNQYLTQYMEKNQTLEELKACYGAKEIRSSSSLAAAVCLTYLTSSEFRNITKPNNYLEVSKLTSNSDPMLSLVSYASFYWFEHMREADTMESPLNDLLQAFLDEKNPCKEIWWHIYWFSASDSTNSVICPSQFSCIHITAYLGLHHALSNLLEIANPVILDSMGRSPLWWSVSMGHKAATMKLLEARVDPNTPDHSSISPVHRAATLGQIDIFEAIMSRQEKLGDEIRDSQGWTPLHWAASRGHVHIIKQILHYKRGRKHYGNRTSTTCSGRTPLHLAALNGHAVAIRDLTGFFIGHYYTIPNIQDSSGYTALHLAAMHGHMHVTKELICNHADVMIRDKTGKTPAQKAKIMGNESISEFLSTKVSYVIMSQNNSFDGCESTERLGKALAKYEMKRFENGFVNSVIENNSRDSHDSSIWQTCVNGHYTSLMVLIGKLRQWRTSDKRGRTTLHHSAAGGYDDCVGAVIKCVEADMELGKGFLDAQDDRGWTALHYAAAGNFQTITKRLLSAGASPHIVNNEGLTSYGIAREEQYKAVMESMAKFAVLKTSDLALDFGWTKLHCYARDGDVSMLKIENLGPQELRTLDVFGKMPIFRAVEAGKFEAVKIIVESSQLTLEENLELTITALETTITEMFHYFIRRIPHNALNGHQNLQMKAHRLFLTAIKRGDFVAAKLLCSVGIDINGYDNSDVSFMQTALHIAIRNRYNDISELLINEGATVTIPDGSGCYLIHIACDNGLKSTVTSLLQHGADPNQQISSSGYSSGFTPLISVLEASMYGCTIENKMDIVRNLLDSGADITIEDADGHSPAWYAHSYFYVPVPENHRIPIQLFNLFRQQRPHLFQPVSAEGLSPSHVAAASGDVNTVKEALENGISVDLESFKYPYKSLLGIAVEEGQAEVVRLLLDYGAALYCPPGNQVSAHKKMLFDISREWGYEEISEMLLTAQRERGLACP